MSRCYCPACRARATRTFERIIGASFTPADIARLARAILPPIPEWTGEPVREAPLPR